MSGRYVVKKDADYFLNVHECSPDRTRALVFDNRKKAWMAARFVGGTVVRLRRPGPKARKAADARVHELEADLAELVDAWEDAAGCNLPLLLCETCGTRLSDKIVMETFVGDETSRVHKMIKQSYVCSRCAPLDGYVVYHADAYRRFNAALANAGAK